MGDEQAVGSQNLTAPFFSHPLNSMFTVSFYRSSVKTLSHWSAASEPAESGACDTARGSAGEDASEGGRGGRPTLPLPLPPLLPLPAPPPLPPALPGA
jgi:hypothetical protein